MPTIKLYCLTQKNWLPHPQTNTSLIPSHLPQPIPRQCLLMGNKDLTETPPNLKNKQTKKKDSRDLKIEHLKYYQCILKERQNNTKQNVILSERKIPAEIKVMYTELTEKWREKKNQHTLKSWIGLHLSQGLFNITAFHLLLFQFPNLQIQFCILINGQEIPKKYTIPYDFASNSYLAMLPCRWSCKYSLVWPISFDLQAKLSGKW